MLGDSDDEKQQERVTTLVKMMESMRDKQAAAILNETEDVVALEVLMRMNVAQGWKGPGEDGGCACGILCRETWRTPNQPGGPVSHEYTDS